MGLLCDPKPEAKVKNLIAVVSMLFCSCVSTLMAQTPVVTSRKPVVVVAGRAFLNQTGGIPPTTLLRTARPGLYRVTIDIEQSDTTGGFGPVASLSWTGDFASYQTELSLPLVSSGNTAAASGELTIHSAAGQPIRVSTTVNPKEQGTYNMYVVIEK